MTAAPNDKRSGLTRRTFLKGAAAVGVTAVAIDMLGCKSSDSGGADAGDPTVVEEGSATNVLETFEEADLALTASATWTLPLGCVLHAAEGAWLPVLAVGDTATQMVKASVLSTASGQLSDVVDSCVSGDGGSWVIYDARCSDSVYAWVEMDILSREWSLYAVSLANGAKSGSATKLQSCDKNYDPPHLACSGNAVLWQTMPSTTGDKTTEHSFCYLWKIGDSKAKAVVDSPGRFACPPSVSDGTVTLAPRVNASKGTFYGITAYDLSSDLSTTVDQLVLPSSVKPFYATRIGDQFAFSIEASYGSGGLLGTMGTYFGSSQGPFVTLQREPSAQVTGTKEGLFIVKSKSSYFVINTKEKTYSVLTATDHSLDYGEYPASEGTSSTFVTFCTVKDASTGYPSQVSVRAFGL